MRNDLLQILACPCCPDASLDLRVFKREKDEIISGELKCSICHQTYLVQEGIPRMLSPAQKASHIKEELKHQEVRQANITYYDSVAEVYEGEVEQAIHQCDFNQRRIDQMVKSLSEKTQRKLFLDLGCGTGNVLKFGKKYFHRAIGVDISFNMLKQARQSGLEVVQADILSLPFKSEVFDVVSIFSVLHHIYDYSLVFGQISRVLKTEGYFYSDWDPTKKPLPNGKKFSWGIYQLAHMFFSKMGGAKAKLNALSGKNGSRKAPIDFLKTRPDLKEINAKAEFHNITEVEKRGIDFLKVKSQLELQGFGDIHPSYHQSGLSLDQLTGVPFLKSKLLTFLGFDPEPFLENILILAKKKTSKETLSLSLEKREKK
jgi:ubiquinone/menaquinone biosynthesis C-methylase UbiE